MEDTKNALTSALQTWFDNEESEQTIQVVVGPLGSGIGHTLSRWAEEHSCKVIDPPPTEEILTGGEEWFRKLQHNKKAVLVLPALEHCYLRHHNGLKLIRKLCEHMKDSSRKWLLGCNSWAWSYLSKAVKADLLLPMPLVLQALHGVHLHQWFGLLINNPNSCCLIFRQSDDGNQILSVKGNKNIPSQEGSEVQTTEGEQATKDVPDFLKKVAALSRGIPLIAWAIWRNSLQIAGETVVYEDAKEAAAKDQGLTIWVRPLEKIDLPVIPSDITRCELFILHVLLLHAGLARDVLCLLLPFHPDEVSRGLTHLESHGVIKHEKNTWRVSLTGYSAVRQYLYNEGYMMDDF